jgi:ribosome biogenesis GTPase A
MVNIFPVKPVSPSDVVELKKNDVLPPKVIEIWNRVIAKNFISGRSYFQQKEILNALVAGMSISRDTVFSERYLDIEDVYRAEGWIVTYDKPAYNESYEATFEFRPKK